MTAQLLAFTGNPRPRVTQAESGIVLILPVVRIELDAAAKAQAVWRMLPSLADVEQRGRRRQAFLDLKATSVPAE